MTGAVAAAAGRELAERLTSLLGDQREPRRRGATRELAIVDWLPHIKKVIPPDEA